MKELKDYLHLYLPVPVELNNAGSKVYNRIAVGVGNMDNEYAYVTLRFDAQTSAFTHSILFSEPNRVKPILRPLSDMTEDEAIELAKLSEWEPHFRDVKVERNEFKDLIVSWDGMVEGGETFNATGELFYCAEQYQWLLSKHFDLFGLIESGLAIDKSNKP